MEGGEERERERAVEDLEAAARGGVRTAGRRGGAWESGAAGRSGAGSKLSGSCGT